MLGGSGHALRENLEMIDAIWCVLMYYFDQISLKKVQLLNIKNIDYNSGESRGGGPGALAPPWPPPRNA